MLTWHELESLCEANRLKRWQVRRPALLLSGRRLYLDPDVHEQIQCRPWPDATGEKPNRTRERRSAMRTALERFVLGHALNLNRDMKELGTRDANEQMREFWEFRSQGPMHETRLFGYFARPGAFIGLLFGSRASMEDEDFEERKTQCDPLWNALFPNQRPIREPWPVLTRSDFKAYLDCPDAN